MPARGFKSGNRVIAWRLKCQEENERRMACANRRSSFRRNSAVSERVTAAFAGPDAYDLFDRQDEDLTVTNSARARGALDGLRDLG